MNKRTLRLAAVLTVCIMLAVMTSVTWAHEEGDIVVYNVWARPTSGGQGGMAGMNHAGHGGMSSAAATMPSAAATMPSAAYFVVENRGGHSIRLSAVTTPVAERTELHQTIVESEIARMEPVEQGVDIPAGEMLAFQPGGYHVMLLDLLFDLKPGDYLALTLTFEMLNTRAEPMDITVGAMVQDLPYETGGAVVWVEQVSYDEDAPDDASAALVIEYREETENALAAIEHMGIDLQYSQRVLDGDYPGERVELDLGPMFEMMFVPESLALPITIILEDGTRFDIALPFGAAHGEHENEHG